MPGICAYEALIKHWLGVEPAFDVDDFSMQAAQSLWLEERYFQHWAEILNKIMG